jgi:SAM-dependent methyltransferase
VSTDQTLANVAGYPPVRWRQGLLGAERALLERHVRPGMRVLELGCGTGRVTRALLEHGAVVTASDLSPAALDAIREELGGSDRLEILKADARDLPFEDGSFELIIFAWNGLDWIHPEEDRERALREAGRLLVPGGRFLFSSHNPLGALFSWRGVRSARMWRWRLRLLISRQWGRRYVRDPLGLLLFQASPRYVIRQTEASGLQFESVLGASGLSRNRLLLTFFSAWPYYAFRKPDARPA